MPFSTDSPVRKGLSTGHGDLQAASHQRSTQDRRECGAYMPEIRLEPELASRASSDRRDNRAVRNERPRGRAQQWAVAQSRLTFCASPSRSGSRSGSRSLLFPGSGGRAGSARRPRPLRAELVQSNLRATVMSPRPGAIFEVEGGESTTPSGRSRPPRARRPSVATLLCFSVISRAKSPKPAANFCRRTHDSVFAAPAADDRVQIVSPGQPHEGPPRPTPG